MKLVFFIFAAIDRFFLYTFIMQMENRRFLGRSALIETTLFFGTT